jgi:hypothetical protein
LTAESVLCAPEPSGALFGEPYFVQRCPRAVQRVRAPSRPLSPSSRSPRKLLPITGSLSRRGASRCFYLCRLALLPGLLVACPEPLEHQKKKPPADPPAPLPELGAPLLLPWPKAATPSPRPFPACSLPHSLPVALDLSSDPPQCSRRRSPAGGALPAPPLVAVLRPWRPSEEAGAVGSSRGPRSHPWVR